jgi:hypothetical protein
MSDVPLCLQSGITGKAVIHKGFRNRLSICLAEFYREKAVSFYESYAKSPAGKRQLTAFPKSAAVMNQPCRGTLSTRIARKTV